MVSSQQHAPAALYPRKKPYPLYRRLGGPQGRSGRAENLAPPGFDPRTVQPVVSRYGLHQLSYPAHKTIQIENIFYNGLSHLYLGAVQPLVNTNPQKRNIKFQKTGLFSFSGKKKRKTIHPVGPLKPNSSQSWDRFRNNFVFWNVVQWPKSTSYVTPKIAVNFSLVTTKHCFLLSSCYQGIRFLSSRQRLLNYKGNNNTTYCS